jgi:hypothetical protein
MKSLIVLAFALGSQISMACIPVPGSFIPFYKVEIGSNQIGSKTGVFEDIKSLEIQHGRNMNFDMATPAVKISFNNSKKSELLYVVSKEVVGCNITKFTAKSEVTLNTLENDLVVEIFDYSHAPCLAVAGDTGVSVTKFGYGHIELGSLNGWGNKEEVYTIQNRCL